MDLYDNAARERLAVEPERGAPSFVDRGPFERDRARVLHSASLRRLAGKTQVVGPQSDDFVRNRLTHSLEVAQVARDLARQLGCDADIVETAALAHDLGHPPFGHNGERALDSACEVAGGFEGNAQTLRILTRLEAKKFRLDGLSAGLNLTRATLDAATKYPWLRRKAPTSPGPAGTFADGTARSSVKFGVYDDDLEVFDWLRQGAPQRQQCLEAQVMDLADDIAYCVHDVEDGVVAGRIDLTQWPHSNDREAVFGTVRAWYAPEADDEQLSAALDRLTSLPVWPQSAYDGGRATQGALKDLTSTLIGRFARAATEETRSKFGAGPLTRYRAHLVLPDYAHAEIALLKGIAAELVMRADDRVAVLETQRTIITELVEVMTSLADHRLRSVLHPSLAEDLGACHDDSGRVRVIADQVASLTDASAVAWHAALVGTQP